jgi:hypothetical protein
MVVQERERVADVLLGKAPTKTSAFRPFRSSKKRRRSDPCSALKETCGS